LELFVEEMIDDEREYVYSYFQQDNATVHTTRNLMSAVQEVFDERTIITELRSPRCPNLSVCDVYLWGNIGRKLYRPARLVAETSQSEIMNRAA
jgi:hypothetical protein